MKWINTQNTQKPEPCLFCRPENLYVCYRCHSLMDMATKHNVDVMAVIDDGSPIMEVIDDNQGTL